MAILAPSLRRLFVELDAAWPRRDHRTDGWVRLVDVQVPNSDHIPDSRGRVHAIDIDKDGIDADYVVSRLIRFNGIISYVIWNRGIWGHWAGFRRQNYTGTSNPHTDHIHVSIFHTDKARNFPGPWGISAVATVELPRYKFNRMLEELNPARGLTGRIDNLTRTAVTLDAETRAVISAMRRHRG